VIGDETINRWRANYGLVERNPIQAAQFWKMTNGGMAPAGAVAALGICLDELAKMQAELAAERARAGRAEENQSDAERIARVWMETAKKAEADRDRLQEAVEVLQKDTYNLTQKVIPNIRKERDNAESELAEARLDAERYRWLRSCVDAPALYVKNHPGKPRSLLAFQALDATIDIARGET
jgi:hypothetical protein